MTHKSPHACVGTLQSIFTRTQTHAHTQGTPQNTQAQLAPPHTPHSFTSVQCPTPEAVPLQSHQSKETSCSLRLRVEGLLSSLAHILQVRRDGGGERDRVTDTLPCIVLYSQKASSHSWMSYFNVTRMAPSQQLYTGRPPTWTGT